MMRTNRSDLINALIGRDGEAIAGLADEQIEIFEKHIFEALLEEVPPADLLRAG